jgi:hypothetical protein
MKAKAETQSLAGTGDAGLKAENGSRILGRKLGELETLIQAQKTSIETLQAQLKKMKEIDLQSEKKPKGIK